MEKNLNLFPQFLVRYPDNGLKMKRTNLSQFQKMILNIHYLQWILYYM